MDQTSLTVQQGMQPGAPARLGSLTPQQEEAAQMFAAGRSWDAIATKVGVSRMALSRWRQVAAFRDRVEDYRAELREQVRASTLADKLRRIASLERDFRATNFILSERGKSLAHVPGGRSGFMCRTFKKIGTKMEERTYELSNGKKVTRPVEVDNVVEVITYDSALMRDRMDLRKQVAHEVGDWADKLELAALDGDPVEVAAVSLAVLLTPDELLALRERMEARPREEEPAIDVEIVPQQEILEGDPVPELADADHESGNTGGDLAPDGGPGAGAPEL